MTSGAEDRARLSRALLQGAVDLHIHTAPDIFPRSVDAIEAAAGLDLLSALPPAVQAAVEAQVDNGPTQ